MSYYASMSGKIIFKEVLPDDKAEKILDIIEYFFESSDLTTIGKNDCLTFSTYSNYYEDEFIEGLNNITKIADILDGEIDCSGEDDDYWRFIWNGSEWIEQNGEITYPPLSREFGKVVWTEQDIRYFIAEHPEFPDDEDFINDVVNFCANDSHFTDTMIEAGWQTIADRAYEVLAGKEGVSKI